MAQIDKIVAQPKHAQCIPADSLEILDLVGLEITDVAAEHAVEWREHQGKRASETLHDARVEPCLQSIDVLEFAERLTLGADLIRLSILVKRCLK